MRVAPIDPPGTSPSPVGGKPDGRRASDSAVVIRVAVDEAPALAVVVGGAMTVWVPESGVDVAGPTGVGV